MTKIDVAIIGGGPGGLQAALVLARTRKKVIIYDRPTPPRNGASHGVHNILGLDGMTPFEIRDQAWSQIQTYQQVERIQSEVLDVERQDEGFVVTTSDGSVMASKVVFAAGFKDNHPELDGFYEAWANTIIPCPFCDGFENRDRKWVIIANSDMATQHLPVMSYNWTSSVRLVLNNPEIVVDEGLEQQLVDHKIPIHRGSVTEIEQEGGDVRSITLDTGEKIEAGTLLWIPDRAKTELEEKMIEKFKLDLDDYGLVQVGENQQTQVNGLYMVGDVVRFGPSALGAMEDGFKAAVAIIKDWF